MPHSRSNTAKHSAFIAAKVRRAAADGSEEAHRAGLDL